MGFGRCLFEEGFTVSESVIDLGEVQDRIESGRREEERKKVNIGQKNKGGDTKMRKK